MRVRVLSRDTQVVKQSYCVSLENPTTEGDLNCGKIATIINHHQIVLNAQRVEQVKHSLGHHRRATQVVLDVLWSVVLLEVGVAHYWSNEARSVLHTMNASALGSGRSNAKWKWKLGYSFSSAKKSSKKNTSSIARAP